MAYIQLKFLVLCVGILFPPTTKGAYEQCVTSLRNTVVHEGTLDTLLNCATEPNGSAWSVRPTSGPVISYLITNYNDVVSPNLTELYAIDQTGLTIRNATTNTTGGPISTAGFYIVQFANTTNRIAFKSVVIRSGPICSCNQMDSENISISCMIVYADHPTGPINAVMNCSANGQFYTSTTPTKTLVPSTPSQYVYNSTSEITVNNTDPTIYDCLITLAAPRPPCPAYVAMNAPDFNATCTVYCDTTTSSITTKTTSSITSTNPPTTTRLATTTTLTSTTGCNCTQNTACPSLDENCTKSSECRSGGTSLTDVYDECVVKAELYAKYDNCCPQKLVCGVVVTLRNDSRWLIHDSSCDDNKCEMVVVDASCMSSGWKLLTERKIAESGVGDYVQAGNSVSISMNMTDCSESCKRMMNLP